ncbi:unnamed protein product [Bursaphelenchus xylophilus]|uniref:(pine wood nematode) hypothetical protein n=1 Tax=Bursaphelenchus xylophilus TaxID=6326 RepID=A0A1I7RU92_BURXY|nr:unnamed protein product [Bursaphelenchus xylophilus]CAG9113942.1 unnamed protein product [Bursaphelenchus xylophilus]
MEFLQRNKRKIVHPDTGVTPRFLGKFGLLSAKASRILELKSCSTISTRNPDVVPSDLAQAMHNVSEDTKTIIKYTSSKEDGLLSWCFTHY